MQGQNPLQSCTTARFMQLGRIRELVNQQGTADPTCSHCSRRSKGLKLDSRSLMGLFFSWSRRIFPINLNGNYVSALKREWTIGLFPRNKIFACMLQRGILQNNLSRKYINKGSLSVWFWGLTLFSMHLSPSSRTDRTYQVSAILFRRIPADKTSLFSKLCKLLAMVTLRQGPGIW